MTDATITPTDNGPYMVEGPARVVDANGTEYDLSEQTTDLPLPLRPLRPQSPSATEPTRRRTSRR